MNPQLYNDYGSWIRSQFSFRVQKISIDGGFSCPNRDGTVSAGEDARSATTVRLIPLYCDPAKSIREQIQTGKDFFARKYPTMRYLAYFQAYSNTYAPLDTLRRRYEESAVAGRRGGHRHRHTPRLRDGGDARLSGGAEPKYFRHCGIRHRVGGQRHAETHQPRSHLRMLKDAIIATHERGILTGGHIILGLPGETAEGTTSGRQRRYQPCPSTF